MVITKYKYALCNIVYISIMPGLLYCKKFIYSPCVLVAGISLVVQNSLVAICSVVLAVAFNDHFSINYCKDVSLFFLVTCVVVITGTLAHLATVANTISIERDWVVVIADKNKNTLASKHCDLH